MQVFRDAGSQAGVRFPDNLMLPKSDWGADAPPGADELLVRRQCSSSSVSAARMQRSDAVRTLRPAGCYACTRAWVTSLEQSGIPKWYGALCPVRSRRIATGRESRTSCWAQPSFPWPTCPRTAVSRYEMVTRMFPQQYGFTSCLPDIIILVCLPCPCFSN